MKLQRFPNLKLLAPAALALAGATLGIANPAIAAPSLTITPISWNVMGLDSNNVNIGPNVYMTGARVCNTGTTAATNVKATFVRDGAINPYVNLQGSSTLSVASLPSGPPPPSQYTIKTTPTNCADFYFNVVISRNSAAYDTRQGYHIEATADSLGVVSTPTPREIYVERLISQNRNAVYTITGPTTVTVGQTYQYTITGKTATQGYEQLVFSPDFPNTIFQVLGVSTTYAAPSGGVNSTIYADACGWENIPSSTYYHNNLACDSPAYASNYSGDKAGGNPISTTYTVKILSTGTATVSNIIYDFSGSSYHYNSDYGSGANLISITAQNPVAGVDLEMGKSHTGNFNFNQDGQYTLTVRNTGLSATTGTISVTDTLPSTGVTYKSATGTGWNCPAASGQTSITCTTSTILAPGASAPPITLTVQPTSTAQFTNTATVSTTGEASTLLGNNTAKDPTIVNTSANISISKTDGLTTVNPSTASTLSTVTYTIVVTNQGTSDLIGIAINDVVPAQIGSVTWSCTSTNGAGNNCTNAAGNGNNISTTVDLKSKATATFTVKGTVASTATGTITNTAQVDTPLGFTDTNITDNTATDTTNVIAPDLTVTKTHTGTPQPGQNVSYVLQTQNIGFGATTGSITVTDQVPAGLTYQSAIGTGWNCSFTSANTTVTCTTSNAIAASSLGNPITVTAKRDSSAAITNTANVSGGGDNNTTNNAASDTLAGVSQLRLVKRITAINTTSKTGFVDGPGTDDTATNWPAPTSTSLQGVVNGGAVRSGDEVEYTIYFLSDGGADAQNVVLCDLVPLNQTLVANAYSTVTAGLGGTAGAPRSIATSVNGAQVSYTDLVDGDAGGFYAVGASVPVPVGGTSPQPCPATNTSANGNGAVVVSLGTLPRATTPGTPAGSYGFVRFKAKVN